MASGEYQKYFEDFVKVVDGKLKSPRDIVAAMTKIYPDRFNTGAVVMGAMEHFR
ncbi:uncharacterized protein ACLA_073220 [Aspergillus clavatus NRRL 1]|uniref:Uncharacterized protein n=1 Tax=Aspergillus clavatus (strain ATCC 1007 / CBS 513.65 / DSM 816 / NCTC 3887 / NRRL 1 / QM 1276 / 107) TaxID=344612 RepID=A1C7B6_ASPCL|nr:uncharacterized protein ACLA_073220 [Aspergillus clavatus NRRL 1]EAW14287.1 hypothetical protein ACLA_073220 [Aspergillus clavatus NRRL 1]